MQIAPAASSVFQFTCFILASYFWHLFPLVGIHPFVLWIHWKSHTWWGGKDKKFSRKERNENFCWWTGWREYRKLTEVRQVVLLFPASLSLLPLCEDVASVDVGEDYSVSLKLWDGFQVWSFCGCQEPHGACDSFQGQTLRHAQINTRHSAFWDARKDSVSDVVWADVLSQFLSCQGCL